MKYNGRGIDVNVAAVPPAVPRLPAQHVQRPQFRRRERQFLQGRAGRRRRCRRGQQRRDRRLHRQDQGRRPSAAASRSRSSPGRFPTSAGTSAGVYADTRYRNDLVGADGRPLTNALFQLPGRRISNSDRVDGRPASLSLDPADRRVSGMRGLFYVDARHMSELNTGSDLDLEKVQEAYTVVNARIGLRGPDDRWAIELWAQNLFDEDFMQVAFDAPAPGLGHRSAASARRLLPAFDPAVRRLPRRAAHLRPDAARQVRAAAGRSRSRRRRRLRRHLRLRRPRRPARTAR